jgi:hypothetical protein
MSIKPPTPTDLWELPNLEENNVYDVWLYDNGQAIFQLIIQRNVCVFEAMCIISSLKYPQWARTLLALFVSKNEFNQTPEVLLAALAVKYEASNETNEFNQVRHLSYILHTTKNRLSGEYVQTIQFLEANHLQIQIDMYLNNNINDLM